MIVIQGDDERGDPVTLVLWDNRAGLTVLQLYRGKRVPPFYEPDGHLASIVLHDPQHSELRKWLMKP